MAFRLSKHSWRTPALLVALAGLMIAQDKTTSARAVLDLTEAEQVRFVNETMDLSFPDDRADQMTMLVINRSSLVLPLIETRVESALESQPPSKAFIETATEMIAYAGDDQSLREISKLIAVDENRFGHFVKRALDNALNWRNPFTVAYRGIEIGDEALSRQIAAWANSGLSFRRMQRLWAEAMLDRYGRVPDESVWATDPIASRLKTGASSDLRQSVLRLATEVQKRRERQ